jgi:energy-coupling factor transporter ATP-binding protein EcfA2
MEPGLTGIVGPNGCGKSNLVEAMRWVMGESSYKAMRASGMDDVIFSGSGNRPGRNSAEVTLVLDNSDRTAPAALNNADILEVTRRIEREAGSVYRVNGKEVRARDVQLLFADASTGAHSPAMVRQGQIGELIAAKPTARRALLEEAAGISGFIRAAMRPSCACAGPRPISSASTISSARSIPSSKRSSARRASPFAIARCPAISAAPKRRCSTFAGSPPASPRRKPRRSRPS